MKITFAQKTAADRAAIIASLASEAKTLSPEDLTAALADIKAQGRALFALDAPTLDQVDEATALKEAQTVLKAEETDRAATAKEAEDRFEEARAAFEDDEPAEPVADGEPAEPVEEPETIAAASENPFKKKEEDPEEDPEDPEKKKKDAMTAAAGQRTISPRRSVAAANAEAITRPAAKATSPVVITASADIPGVPMNSQLAGMPDVAGASIARVGGYPDFNETAALTENERSGGAPVLHKHGIAKFNINFNPAMVASGTPGQEYAAMQFALKDHESALQASMAKTQTLTAAGWCAPSDVALNYLADYVVDGLLTTPQVSAPRAGIMTTTGPALAQGTFAGDAGLDAFGWSFTEAQAIANTVKTCEVIECPTFQDHRLDVVGYCWKIPILTQNAWPELITDALRLSSVLYAHKLNRRFIQNSLALSNAVTLNGLGASFTDTLEALAIQATKERRKWNVGSKKVMEVKMPLWVMEVFRAEISRRAFTTAPVTDQQIVQEFTTRNLAPEWVNDWAELTDANPVFPAAFPVMIYPAGTFAKVVKDVINLSTVYDAASLSINEYTGVFFEQGVLLYKVGYGSTKMTVPICTAGLVGASVLDCHPESANWDGQKQAVVA